MITTHSHKIKATSPTGQPHFHLTELSPISTNVEVRRYPKRIIAWGLSGDEQVSVHIARVQALGNPNWTLTDDCRPCSIEPGIIANTEHMPYQRHNNPVKLTANSPAIHIDDAGTYYFEYHGANEVVIDHYDDPVIRKTDGGGCI